MPFRCRIDVEREHKRIVEPPPAVGESRAVSFFVVYVEIGSDVGEVVVDLFDDLFARRRDDERRKQRSRILFGCNDERATGISAARSRGVTGARSERQHAGQQNVFDHSLKVASPRPPASGKYDDRKVTHRDTESTLT